VDEPPAAVVTGQFEQCADSPLAESASLEAGQHHPADLGHGLAVVVVRPQHHRSRDFPGCNVIGNDHLDPCGVRRRLPGIVLDLLLDARAGQRSAELGRHDRIAPHPDVRVDVPELDISQAHQALLSGAARSGSAIPPTMPW
jgi:hypothetical protein